MDGNASGARAYLLPVLLLVGLAAISAAVAPRFARGRTPASGEASAALDALRDAFNAERDRARLLAVLSPTCPICREGATDVEDLQARFGEGLWAGIVWTRALPWDLDQKAGKRLGEFRGGGLALFDDPFGRVAAAVTLMLRWPPDGTAWDVYMIWPPGAVWDSELPSPAAWFHQRHEVGGEELRGRPELAAAMAGVLQGIVTESPRSGGHRPDMPLPGAVSRAPR